MIIASLNRTTQPSHGLLKNETGKDVTRETDRFLTGGVVGTYDEGPEEWDSEEPLEKAGS